MNNHHNNNASQVEITDEQLTAAGETRVGDITAASGDETDAAAEPTPSAPSVREIAALTARLRALSAAGTHADPAERARFLADKNALIARITATMPGHDQPEAVETAIEQRDPAARRDIDGPVDDPAAIAERIREFRQRAATPGVEETWAGGCPPTDQQEISAPLDKPAAVEDTNTDTDLAYDIGQHPAGHRVDHQGDDAGGAGRGESADRPQHGATRWHDPGERFGLPPATGTHPPAVQTGQDTGRCAATGGFGEHLARIERVLDRHRGEVEQTNTEQDRAQRLARWRTDDRRAEATSKQELRWEPPTAGEWSW